MWKISKYEMTSAGFRVGKRSSFSRNVPPTNLRKIECGRSMLEVSKETHCKCGAKSELLQCVEQSGIGHVLSALVHPSRVHLKG